MTALDVVMKDIEERRKSIVNALCDGAAHDYASYQNMCGEIRGLSLAHSFLTDLVRKMESDDE
jgi:hypothetical protein